MKEQWKTIPGFKWHEVSNHGRVRKLIAMREPFYHKLVPDKHGGQTVSLSINKVPEGFRVARLVGQLFCPDFKPNLRPLHLDGNKANCRADNLKWVSVSEVTAHPYSRNPRPSERSALGA